MGQPEDKKRVILIEPASTIRIVLEIQLRMKKYQLIIYSDYEEALVKMPQLDLAPHFIIVDVNDVNVLPDILTVLQTCAPSASLVVFLPTDLRGKALAERITRTVKARLLFKPFHVNQVSALLANGNPLRAQ